MAWWKFHLFVNSQRADAVTGALAAIKWLAARNVVLAADSESAEVLHVPALGLPELGKADLMVCFGGDGTLIRAAEFCSEFGTPILGVYYGRFGFVTQCEPHEVGSCLSEFIDGTACYEERMMIRADLMRANQPVTSLHLLNDMALQRSVSTRMLVFSIEVDGRHLTSYPADGILVSTPTGSTAYNLSTGGPILDPGVQALILTAMAPIHSAQGRSC